MYEKLKFSALNLFTLFSLTRVLIIFVILLHDVNHLKNLDVPNILCFVIVVLLTLFFHIPNLAMTSVGLTDFLRKRHFMKMVTLLIDFEAGNAKNSTESFFIPTLNIIDHENIRKWYNLRSVAMDLGRQYTIRIFAIASLLLSVYSLLAILVLLMQLGFVKYELNWSLYVVQYTDLFMVLSILFTMLIIGAYVNMYYNLHKSKLLQIKMTLFHIKRQYWSLLDKKEYTSNTLKNLMEHLTVLNLTEDQVTHKIDLIIETIDNVIEKLEDDSQSVKLKLIGFE